MVAESVVSLTDSKNVDVFSEERCEDKNIIEFPPTLLDLNPETYIAWKIQISSWKETCSVEQDKLASTIYFSLPPTAKEAVLNMDFKKLNTDDGLSNLLKELDRLLLVDFVENSDHNKTGENNTEEITSAKKRKKRTKKSKKNNGKASDTKYNFEKESDSKVEQLTEQIVQLKINSEAQDYKQKQRISRLEAECLEWKSKYLDTCAELEKRNGQITKFFHETFPRASESDDKLFSQNKSIIGETSGKRNTEHLLKNVIANSEQNNTRDFSTNEKNTPSDVDDKIVVEASNELLPVQESCTVNEALSEPKEGHQVRSGSIQVAENRDNRTCPDRMSGYQANIQNFPKRREKRPHANRYRGIRSFSRPAASCDSGCDCRRCIDLRCLIPECRNRGNVNPKLNGRATHSSHGCRHADHFTSVCQMRQVRCFKCKNLGHLARYCHTTKRCYACNRLGHLARHCDRGINERPHSYSRIFGHIRRDSPSIYTRASYRYWKTGHTAESQKFQNSPGITPLLGDPQRIR